MAELIRPGYEPDSCRIGVVHLGIGSFHRAHQALYFDELLHDPANSGWALAGVNLLPQGAALLEQLARRANRYVLRTVTPEGENSYREIASIRRLVDHVSDPEAAVALLAEPEVRLITMTVTETGYHLDKFGRLTDSGSGASSIYPYLRAGLNARREAQAGPITLMSCDNVQENSMSLRSGLLQYLEACSDSVLLEWLEENATFPCGMVDRITPAPREEDARFVEQEFGIADDATIMAESFVQWVIEDDFAGARPPLDRAGAQFTADVKQHEEAKLRLLNAGHSSIAYQAARRGIKLYDQAMAEPELAEFFERFHNEEVIPSLGGGGEIDLEAYSATVRRRFTNPHIGDTVERITRHGADKLSVFILPTMKALLEAGRIPELSLTIFENWYGFMRDLAAGKIDHHYDEPRWEELQPYLAAGQERAFASWQKLWGDLPVEHPEFVDALTARLESID